MGGQPPNQRPPGFAFDAGPAVLSKPVEEETREVYKLPAVSHRDVIYGIRNMVNNIVITLYGDRW